MQNLRKFVCQCKVEKCTLSFYFNYRLTVKNVAYKALVKFSSIISMTLHKHTES